MFSPLCSYLLMNHYFYTTDFPALGRFVIRDMKQTVAVGIIKATTKELAND